MFSPSGKQPISVQPSPKKGLAELKNDRPMLVTYNSGSFTDINTAITGAQSVLHVRENRGKFFAPDRSKSISINPSTDLMAKTENIFSPKGVIFAARRESDLNRTEIKLKSTFARPYAMSLNEHVDNALANPKWGIDLYKPRNLTLN